MHEHVFKCLQYAVVNCGNSKNAKQEGPQRDCMSAGGAGSAQPGTAEPGPGPAQRRWPQRKPSGELQAASERAAGAAHQRREGDG